MLKKGGGEFFFSSLSSTFISALKIFRDCRGCFQVDSVRVKYNMYISASNAFEKNLKIKELLTLLGFNLMEIKKIKAIFKIELSVDYFYCIIIIYIKRGEQ